jgi:hypothetical protein
MSENGWHEYQKLVLAELTRLDEGMQKVQEDVSQIRLAVAVLRTKAVTWGALGGLITWTMSLAFTYWRD